MRARPVGLRELTAVDLAVVEPWFGDADTRRRLGDEAWPRRLLELAGRSAERVVLAATRAGRVVGVLDVERYSDGRAAIALVVGPAERRTGIATAALDLLAREALVRGISELVGGVEADNVAALALARSAGFAQVTDGPDDDGFLYVARRTDGQGLPRPWTPPRD